jgi:hypothetical protein
MKLANESFDSFGKIKFPRGVIGDDGKQFVKGVSVLLLPVHIGAIADIVH